jgi:hypothetical protein
VLTFVLITPLVDRGMSWDEAGWAIVICLTLSPIFASLVLRLAPKKVRDKPADTARWRRRWALILGIVGFLYCMALGPFVTLSCAERAADGYRRSQMIGMQGDSRGYGWLAGRRAVDDRRGQDLGTVVSISSLLPLALVVASATRKTRLFAP